MASITRRDFFKLALAGVSVAAMPRVVAAELEGVPTRVLWLSWDGADWRCVSDMLAKGQLPNLAALNPVRLDAVGVTMTKPGHVEAITGLEYNQSHVIGNQSKREVPAADSFFYKLREAYPDYWQGVIYSKGIEMGDQLRHPWRPMKDWAATGGLNYYRNASPVENAPMDWTNGYLAEAVAAFASPGLLYCHWAEPDASGHHTGMGSSTYRYNLQVLDTILGSLTAQIDPDFVLIYSDHGFSDFMAQEHMDAPYAFIASSVRLIPNGVRRDIAYTMLRVMGLDPTKYEPQLQGKRQHHLHGKDLRL